ncbi:endothelial cell-specific chemotaxis regulator isoform X2 [Ursus americanus]|uniref:endothelial cell-specific chemotaxis regulator isoform X2 n=1 Tax=Ursus americanus TaxID=9643 RepID=UPI001E67D5E0|nr:endothelial cell-specific chemotaxis regulator isoform X2 [Ursus americanus]
MGTAGATQLSWAILGFLLLQGHHSQPMTMQTSHAQGAFSSQSLTAEPLSSNVGDSPSSESSSPSPLAGTGTPAAPEKASQVLAVASKPVTPSTSTVDGHSQSPLGVTQSQTQKYTAGLDTSQNVTPISTTMNLRTGEDLSILPSPTSETVLTVAAFDPQKPGSSGLSESCSAANGEKDSITLISMKNINTNNSKGCPTAEKVL